MYEQDKFDEESQIEAVTVQDAGTEDEDVANDNNVWRIRYNNANCDIFCWIKMNPRTKILLYVYFLSRIDAMTISMDEIVGNVGDSEIHMHGEIGKTYFILSVQWFPLYWDFKVIW